MTAQRSAKLGLVIGAVLACGVATAFGEFIVTVVPQVSHSSGETWAYEYLIKNESTSDETVFDFSLEFGDDIELSSMQAPSGWEIFYSPGASHIAFFSSSAGGDIFPGLEGKFGFSANFPPNHYPAKVTGENAAGGGEHANVSVPVPGPELSVPEPGSKWLICLGCVVALALARSRLRPRAMT